MRLHLSPGLIDCCWRRLLPFVHILPPLSHDTSATAAVAEAEADDREDGAEVERPSQLASVAIRLLRNSTGGAIWLVETDNDAGRNLVPNGHQVQIAEQASESEVTVYLDGEWNPPFKVPFKRGLSMRCVLSSDFGPGFAKLKKKHVEVVCEAVEVGATDDSKHSSEEDRIAETAPGTSASLDPQKQEEQTGGVLLVDIHSTVLISNNTDTPFQLLDMELLPSEEKWLPLMVVSTGSVQIRPNSDYYWSPAVSFQTYRSEQETATNASQQVSEEYNTTQCLSSKMGLPRCYSFRIRRNLGTGITHIYVLPPVVVENYLPCPVTVSIFRPSTTGVRYYIDAKSYDEEYDPPSDRSQLDDDGNSISFNYHVDRKDILEDEHWDVFGGKAFAPALLKLKLKDTPECRVGHYLVGGELDLGVAVDQAPGKGVFTLATENQELMVHVYVRDVILGKTEAQAFRRLRIFCDYVFIDRTGLSLRFSCDKKSSSRTFFPNPDNSAAEEERLPRKVMFEMPAQTEKENHFVFVSTHACPEWSAATDLGERKSEGQSNTSPMGSKSVDSQPGQKAHREGLTSSSTEFRSVVPTTAAPTNSRVVRVPVSMNLAPIYAQQPTQQGVPKLKHFAFEVVVASNCTPGRELPGPMELSFVPRLRIVNNTGCAFAVRQYDDNVRLGASQPDRELPFLVPSRRSIPFIFYSKGVTEQVSPLHLQALALLPVFISDTDTASTVAWEWGDRIRLDRPHTLFMAFHNINLDRRLLVQIEVM